MAKKTFESEFNKLFPTTKKYINELVKETNDAEDHTDWHNLTRLRTSLEFLLIDIRYLCELQLEEARPPYRQNIESIKNPNESNEEFNRIKTVNYIVSGDWIEHDSDGFAEYPYKIKLPNDIKLKGYSRGCNMSIDVALEYLMNHIKKGRK